MALRLALAALLYSGLIGWSGHNSAVWAAELVMLEESGCPWCDKWKEEIGVVYSKTNEGKRAPLTILDMHETLPARYKFIGRASFSPTFVLIDGQQEVGRIRGYPGEDFFWPMLQQLLDRLDKPSAVKPVAIN